MGYDVVTLPPFSKLQEGICCHTDMLLFYFGEKLYVHKEYYENNKTLFESLMVELVLSEENISKDYPNDVLFNAVLTSEKVLFARLDAVSEYIKNLAKKCVNVKQGYTACSTCKVADRAYITTDKGLFEAYKSVGIDVLLIEKTGIDLPGYDCGFIGGASAVLDEKICFFGQITKHQDYEKIAEFVSKYNKKIVELSDEKLTDIGGCVALL